MIVIIIVLTIVIVIIVVVVFILVVIVDVVLLSVLGCEFGLHLVNGSSLKFLTHSFLFFLPIHLPLVSCALTCTVIRFGWCWNVRVERVIKLVVLHLVL